MKLIALIYFALSLFGFDTGGSTYVTRTTVDGADVLYSRATAGAGSTRFECVRSTSGQCHYTVYPRTCTTDRCRSAPIERFALANGGSRQVSGLHGFHLCVSADGGVPGPDCEPADPLVQR